MSNSSSSAGGNSPPQKSTPPFSNNDDNSETPPSPSSDTTPPSSSSKSPPPTSSSTTPPSPSSNSPPSPSSKLPPSPSSEDSTPPSPSSEDSTPPSPSSKPPPPSPSTEDSTPPLPSSNPPPPSPSSNPPPPSPSANPSPPPPSPSSSSKSTPPPLSSSSTSPSPPPPSSSSNTPPPLPSSNTPPPPSSSSNSTLLAQGSKSPPPPASSNSPPPGPPPPSLNGSPPPPTSQGNNSPPPFSAPSSAIPLPTENQPPGPLQNFVPPPAAPPANGPSPISKPSPITNDPPTTPSNPEASTAPIADQISNRAAVIVTISALVVIILVIAFVLISRKRRTDLKHQSPGRISVKTDGYKQPTPIGVSGRSNPYYSSGPLFGPLGVVDGSARYGYNSGSQLCFTYEEMMDVTDGFSEENIIGEGGFGCVYKGCLQDGKKVAVKQLKVGSGQGEREFRAEVEIISRVHHRYLVSLVGYCIAESHRLLVYEFLPNNTLEHHLHGLPVMEWPKRVKIAIGSAKGLAYLHEDCHPRIIHRDIKSANILLEDSFEPQVADFGLAKLSNDTASHVSTRVMGTFGYMAPEYASSGKLTDRSDVFSFGVVLLELITGRKPVDTTQPLGDESLVEWARPLLVHALETGECDELVDPRLENNYDKTEMLRMIEAAAACVRHSAPKRPRMSQVVRALDIEDDMQDLTNRVKIGKSQAFNSGQASSSEVQKFRQMAFGSSGTDSFKYDSGEYDRRSAAHSGNLRRDQRPPGPGGRRPGAQSSNSSTNNEIDTCSMFQSENSTGGGNSRGAKYY